VGTIVGSAVFNILFVIALCALISTTVCELDAYPIVRDAGFYCIAVAVLYIIIYDQRVFWYEALALVLLYFVYVGILKFNDRLSRLIRGNSTHRKTITSNEPHQEQLQALNDSVELEQNLSIRARSVSESVMMSTGTHTTGTTSNADAKRHLPYKPSKKRLKDTPDNQQIVANATEIFDPLKLPTKRYKILKWVLMYPVRLLMHITIPDCRKEVFHNYYMLTFVMSTIWVSNIIENKHISYRNKERQHFLSILFTFNAKLD
jgi:sodium/potassium/calcium exchanger 5